ncbi:cupin domain-containing protein [Aestuariicella hydrocarbonica]|uniref:Cupin domain-containing protein n=1 Tax=Pseudomaricurvus hydrocarbonicus TaxID=1470433 RepID=A0A9E5JX23_9GAMM|nr:cupin domain-containing protein [Aestuariicella hydrocarbonica]NHO66874.1 cupin domain-containing protein [Aestuariicella hydrocarbonica]
MSKLPSVRRIVTGHNAQGKAVFINDAAFETQLIPSGDAEFTLLWTAPDLPVDNNDPVDGREREAGLTLNGGSVMRVVDMLPGESSPMHRTNSLDYGIVLSGELELELDDGEKTLLHAGDIVVQRGTMHLWRNPSATERCRIVFILTEATAVEVDGKPLPELHP